MQKDTLIQIATEMGYVTEVSKGEFCDMLGLRKDGEHVWHWFEIDRTDDSMWFNHSYSMNTGKTRKNLAHKMNINERFGFYRPENR